MYVYVCFDVVEQFEVAPHRNTPLRQHTAVQCSTLPHTATHRRGAIVSVLRVNGVKQREDWRVMRRDQHQLLQCVAVCRSVLQCVAVCCSVLQCVAVSTTWRLTRRAPESASNVYDTNHLGVQHASFIFAKYLIHMCNMPVFMRVTYFEFYVQHVSRKSATCLILTCDMPHSSYVQRASFICATCLTHHMCNMPHSTCTLLIYTCDMTHF